MIQQKPGRRIVGKRQYIQVQGKRTGLIVSGLGLLIIAFISTPCVLFYCLYTVFMTLTQQATWEVVALMWGAALCWTCLTWGLWWVSIKILTYSAEINTVTPLTRANTGSLSATESLVRASREPPQFPEAILLRAATETLEKHKEQLLRASPEEQKPL